MLYTFEVFLSCSSFDTYRDNIENERLINMEQLKSNQPNNVCTQTLGYVKN
jgi:hypothetical protein